MLASADSWDECSERLQSFEQFKEEDRMKIGAREVRKRSKSPAVRAIPKNLEETRDKIEQQRSEEEEPNKVYRLLVNSHRKSFLWHVVQTFAVRDFLEPFAGALSAMALSRIGVTPETTYLWYASTLSVARWVSLLVQHRSKLYNFLGKSINWFKSFYTSEPTNEFLSKMPWGPAEPIKGTPSLTKEGVDILAFALDILSIMDRDNALYVNKDLVTGIDLSQVRNSQAILKNLNFNQTLEKDIQKLSPQDAVDAAEYADTCAKALVNDQFAPDYDHLSEGAKKVIKKIFQKNRIFFSGEQKWTENIPSPDTLKSF